MSFDFNAYTNMLQAVGMRTLQSVDTPTVNDDDHALGTHWINTTADTIYVIVDNTSGAAVWKQLSVGGSGGDAQDSVLSIADCTAAPPSESTGDRYIVDDTAGSVHADWDGAAKEDIVEFDGSLWVSTTPTEGTFVEVEDVNTVYIFITTWEKLFDYVGVTFTTDTGNAVPDNGIVNILGGEGIDTSGATDTITITCEDASETNKGILEIATDAEAVAVTLTDKAIVPSNFTPLFASPPVIGGTAAAAANFTTISMNNQLTNTLADGTTPFLITSTTVVDNLNVSRSTLSDTITVVDESADTECFVSYFTAATGNLPIKTGTNLTFNSNTGILTSTGFVGDVTGNVTGSSGSCTGNAATATLASTVTVIDTTDATCFVGLFDEATGSLAIKTDAGLSYAADTGTLTSTVFTDGTATLTGGAWSGISTLAMTSTLTNSSLNTANGIVQTSVAGVFSTSVDLPTATTIGSGYIYRVSGTDVSIADGGTNSSSALSNGLMMVSSGSAIVEGTPTVSGGAIGAVTTLSMSGLLTTTAGITVNDTRAVNSAPTDYDRQITFDFKTKASMLSGAGPSAPTQAGTYGGMFTFAPWSDDTGGNAYQMFFLEGGIAYRYAPAGDANWTGVEWATIPDTSHSFTMASGTTITGSSISDGTATLTGGALTGLTNLTVDNLNLNLNTISSTAGAINITPYAGSAVVIDNHWSFDGPAMTAIVDANTTMVAYAGKYISIEGVQFDGNHVTLPSRGQLKLYNAENTSYANMYVSNSQLYSTLTASTGGVFMLNDPLPLDGTSPAEYRYFRSTNTSGAVTFTMYRGDSNARYNFKLSCQGTGTGTPAFELFNAVSSDADGARQTRITFRGYSSSTSSFYAGQIVAMHDGAAADQKGRLVFYCNDGNDGYSPSEVLRLDSAKLATFAGNISAVTVTGTTVSGTNITATATVQGADLLATGASAVTVTINDTGVGDTALTRTMSGCELIVGGMNTTSKYTPALKFMSTDPQLTTENPKLLAAIAGRATEGYTGDTRGGMHIDFFTTANNPGATNIPALVCTMQGDLDTVFKGLVTATDLKATGTTPVNITINDTGTATTALTRAMSGFECIIGAANATLKYTPALKFMSTDPQFTTENPKLLAAIAGRATETYGGDTSGGMAIDFFTTANAPGATNVPALVFTVQAPLTTANGIILNDANGLLSSSTDLPTATTIGSAYIYRVGGTDVSIADGGTNSSAALANGLMMVSVGGAIVEGTPTVVGGAIGAVTTLTASGLVQGSDLEATGTTGVLITLDNTDDGHGALTRTMSGFESIVGSSNIGFKYLPPLKFMCTDVNFSTENPKFLAAVDGIVTENYAADTDGGMAVGIFATANAPGATNVPALVCSFQAPLTAANGILRSDAAGALTSSTDLPTATTIGSGYIYRAGGTDVAIADGGTNSSGALANGLMMVSSAGAIIEGTPTVVAGAIGAVTTLNASGAITGGTLTDGTASLTGGVLTASQVAVDNLDLNGNTLSSTSGDINIIPLGGEDVVIDTHWEFDGTVLTAITDNNTTITAFAGKNITIESVTFDGGSLGATIANVSGTVTGGTVTDSTASLSGGALTGLTNLTVDNINVDGNQMTSTSGAMAIGSAAQIDLTPAGGSAVIIDTSHSFDGIKLTANGLIYERGTVVLADNATHTFTNAGASGWGRIQSLTENYWIEFTFSTTSVTTALQGTDFTSTTSGVDGDMCVYANAAGATNVELENKIGAQRTFLYELRYA